MPAITKALRQPSSVPTRPNRNDSDAPMVKELVYQAAMRARVAPFSPWHGRPDFHYELFRLNKPGDLRAAEAPRWCRRDFDDVPSYRQGSKTNYCLVAVANRNKRPIPAINADHELSSYGRKLVTA
jgi:hypothetical protein